MHWLSKQVVMGAGRSTVHKGVQVLSPGARPQRLLQLHTTVAKRANPEARMPGLNPNSTTYQLQGLEARVPRL